MPSLIIFLAAAVAATVGPWVDAPALLSTLSGCIAIAVAWISMASLRRSLHEAQNKIPPSPPEVDPTQSADSSMLQSRLQVESMRVQALESELRETKKKHGELLADRIELLRRTTPIEPNHSSKGPPNLLQGGREAAQSIRQRDLWIQAQQASLGEFRSGLNQVTHNLQRCLNLFHSISLTSLNEGAIGNKSALQLKALLAQCTDTFERAAKDSQPPLGMLDITPPDSIDGICTGFLSLKNRLEEVADQARVASMNARLLKDRPADTDALDSLDEEMANVSAGLKKLLNFSGPFAPDLEKTRRQIEDNTNALAGLVNGLKAQETRLEQRLARTSEELSEGMNRLKHITETGADSEEKRRIELEQIEVAVQDTTEALTNACNIAHSLDLIIERMVEVSKIATGLAEPVRMPLETSAND